MKARLDSGHVMLGQDGLTLYEQSGFGRPLKEGVRLSPVEALYLVYRGRIEVPGFDFDSLLVHFSDDVHVLRSFLVYRDIRERGYVVQTGPQDFRIFRRGEKPGKGESLYMLRVLSERDLIDFAVVRKEVQTTANMRKRHVLAVVDDEFELTYYEVKVQKPAPLEPTQQPEPVNGLLSSRSVIIPAAPESAYDQGFYGKRFDDERIVLSTIESISLMEQGLVTVEHQGHVIPAQEYREMIREFDTEMEPKLQVYQHLRSLNYIPKTGYKFGHHFRVYLGRKVHSEMLVQAIEPDTTLPMNSISRSVRMAHSVKKKMLFGCIHAEGIAYVEFARIKL
ncbi:tRNA-intron lyase [Methanospirillum sp.]|uniref:tRNA-intron lyase n=1 Tax=Methanospirillum sp. TaxID=45200 RepID=UPI0026376387|nr:tRNA-intron lyase [Methanospirillum sp.]